jgi:hypothetical protein
MERKPQMPLFKITCVRRAARVDAPHAGSGRALVTGKCADVGSIVM